MQGLGFHDGMAPCRLALLPVGVSISVGRRAVGRGTDSVTVEEQPVSDQPTSPWEHNPPVMSEPSFAMATSHDGTDWMGIFMLCLCAPCVLVPVMLNPCHHRKTWLVIFFFFPHRADNLSFVSLYKKCSREAPHWMEESRKSQLEWFVAVRGN